MPLHQNGWISLYIFSIPFFKHDEFMNMLLHSIFLISLAVLAYVNGLSINISSTTPKTQIEQPKVNFNNTGSEATPEDLER